QRLKSKGRLQPLDLGLLIPPAAAAGPDMGPGQIVKPRADFHDLCLGIDEAAFHSYFVLLTVSRNTEHQFPGVGIVFFRHLHGLLVEKVVVLDDEAEHILELYSGELDLLLGAIDSVGHEYAAIGLNLQNLIGARTTLENTHAAIGANFLARRDFF